MVSACAYNSACLPVNAYFFISVLVLALVLFFPVSKLIWVLSVRRLQRKERRELSSAELHGQLKRARMLAVVVSLVFSYLFNLTLGGSLGYA